MSCLFFRPSRNASVFRHSDTDLFLAEKDGLVDSVVVVVVVVVVAAVPDLKDPRDRIRGRKRLLNRGDAAVVGGAGLVLTLLPPRVLSQGHNFSWADHGAQKSVGRQIYTNVLVFIWGYRGWF